jgi:thiosulfate dehydrogenase (quinone) large subunit
MHSNSALIRYVELLTPILLRLALGVSFLSAVGDRFGIWGPPGARHIAWGNFTRFTQYAAQLNPWAPPALVPGLAWTATAAELVFGVALIAGFYVREAALASGVLLLLFAVGMTIGTGVKSALDASVFSAAAAAFALSLLGPGSWSLDGLRR